MEAGVKMVNAFGKGGGISKSADFEETELRLGLPGRGDKEEESWKNNKVNVNGKRNFAQTMDLKLSFSSKEAEKESTSDKSKNLQKHKDVLPGSNEPVKPPPAKAQAVGWPPVRSFRKKILAVPKNRASEGNGDSEKVTAAFVKVSMDGAPYLRKVDLKMYNSYQQLSEALGNMFCSSTIGSSETQGMMDFMNNSKLVGPLNNADYFPTYEDKDGDWMLVGDVPWEMFVESCKRLRITRGTEAIGLAPRALAKCKSRS